MSFEENTWKKKRKLDVVDGEASLFGLKKAKRRITWRDDLASGPTAIRPDEHRAFALFLLCRGDCTLGFHDWRGLNIIERTGFETQARAWHSLFGTLDFKTLSQTQDK